MDKRIERKNEWKGNDIYIDYVLETLGYSISVIDQVIFSQRDNLSVE